MLLHNSVTVSHQHVCAVCRPAQGASGILASHIRIMQFLKVLVTSSTRLTHQMIIFTGDTLSETSYSDENINIM